ncbi:MAG: alpha/beta hydrolase [Bacteroidota bacterium]
MADKYGLDIIAPSGKKNLIIFIHGLVGGKETWLRTDKRRSVLDYLYSNSTIREHYDFAVYSYYTKASDLLSNLSYFLKLIYFKKSSQFQKNQTVEKNADILYAELKNSGYENLIFVAHSMGGLISKSAILKLTDDNTKKRDSSPNVRQYFSLAVPHEGSDLAFWATLFLRSGQIANLRPLNKFRKTINQKWLRTPPDKLPETIYFKGANDWVVADESSLAYEIREVQVIDTQDDHFSIVKPSDSNNIVIKVLKKALRENVLVEELAPDDATKVPVPDEPTPSPNPKLNWRAVLITVTLALLFLSFYIFKPPVCKDNPICFLDLKAFWGYNKSDTNCTMADYFGNSDLKSDEITSYSIPGFINNYIGEREQIDSLTLSKSIEENENDTFLIFKFHLTPKQDRNYSAFIIKMNAKANQSFRIINNKDWLAYGDGEIFSKRKLSDTLTLKLNKSILKE